MPQNYAQSACFSLRPLPSSLVSLIFSSLGSLALGQMKGIGSISNPPPPPPMTVAFIYHCLGKSPLKGEFMLIFKYRKRSPRDISKYPG